MEHTLNVSSFLRPLVDAVNADEAKRSAETFRFMEEQKIKKALAPKEWEKLKAQLIQECGKFSQSTGHQLQSEPRGLNELKLRNASTGRMAKFTYNADVPCIFFEGYDGGGHFAFRPSADGTLLQWVDTKRNSVTTINELVFEITAYLIH